MSNVNSVFSAKSLASIRSHWRRFVALGLLLIAMGILAGSNLVLATIATIYFIGAVMLIAGLGQVIHAFSVKAWSSFFWWLLGGIIYVMASLSIFANPVFLSSFLTLFLAVMLIISGLFRGWAALQARQQKSWVWLLISSAVTILTGIVIGIGWPVNSLWIIGLLLAIDLIVQGWSLTAFGLGLRSMVDQANREGADERR